MTVENRSRARSGEWEQVQKRIDPDMIASSVWDGGGEKCGGNNVIFY